MVDLLELRHPYQNRQKLMEESVRACRSKVRLRIRSFWWQESKEPTCSVVWFGFVF